MGLLAICYPKLQARDEGWIESIRKKYDPHYKLVDAHFSLVFEIPNIGPDEFAAQMRPICQATPGIEFNLRCAMVMPGIAEDNWYLFLVPDLGYSDIVRLHDCLYSGVLSPHLRLDIPYVPHITVGIFNDAHSCKKAADELNHEIFDIAGLIETVDIISANLESPGQERLETVERIKLGSGKV